MNLASYVDLTPDILRTLLDQGAFVVVFDDGLLQKWPFLDLGLEEIPGSATSPHPL
jgi:hypothetical protein